jgi:hypothetical protein
MNKAHMLLLQLLFFTGTIQSRNPFCFGYAVPQLLSIGMLEPERRKFARISLEEVHYTVFLGDVVGHYKIITIEKNHVIVKNLKNKKALQLKIS